MRYGCIFLLLCSGALAALDEVTDVTTAVVSDPGGAGGFQRGDCNQDRKLDIADAICTLGFLFKAEATTCKAALDGNDDNKVDIADAIYVLSHLFAHGPAPRAPFGVCGQDPTPGMVPLPCASHRACSGGASNTRIVKIANDARFPITVPLLAVIDAISEPGVTCANADGTYLGKPCFDYSAAVAGGALAVGGETDERTWSFTNPTGRAFTLTIRVFGSTGAAGWLPGGSMTEDGGAPDRTPDTMEVGTVVYTIEVPGVVLTQRDVETGGKSVRYQELSAPKCGTTGLLGMPSIPSYTQLIAVPKGAQISVSVKPGAPVVYEGLRVMPLQRDQVDYDGVEPSPFFQHNDYRRNAFYPESLWSVDVQTMRGMRIAALRVTLGQFNGATGVLRLYPELKVQVEFPGAQGKAPASFADAEQRAPGFESIGKTTLLNGSLAVVGVDATVAGRMFVDRFRDLLIITAPAFNDQALELAEWKTDRGLRTIVATTDDTGTTVDDIADYIAWQYAFRGIEYVLLLGDADHIPTFQGSTHPWNPPSGHSPLHIGTDLFYVTMDGAGDFLPDMALGRISVDSDVEAQRIVDRIINYEGAFFMAADFFTHPVLAAYFQDNDPRDGQTEKGYVQTCEEIVTYLDDHGYAPTRVYTTQAAVTPEHYSDGTDIPAYLEKPGFAWDGTGADVVDAINAGTFMVAHRDHGDRGGWTHPSFTSAMADGLTNGDTRLPLMFSLNCQTGWFDCETDEAGYNTLATSECFAEHMLRAVGGGAIAVITPTRNSPSGANDQILRGMIDCVWPTFLPAFPAWDEDEAEDLAGSRRIGHIMNYGKFYMWSYYGNDDPGDPNIDNISRSQFQCELYQCLGDPTVNLRKSNPRIAVVRAPVLEPLFPDYRFELPPELDGGLASIVQRGEILGQAIVRGGEAALKLRAPLEDLPDTVLNVEREGYRPVSVPIQFKLKRTLYALRVPTEKPGAISIAAYTADAAGELEQIGAASAGTPGVQSCCKSGFVGTAQYLFAGTNQGNQIAMLAFKADGNVSEVRGSPFETAGQNNAYFAVNRAGTMLFARTGDTVLEAFTISASGLATFAKPFLIGPSARALATYDSFGREWLYVGESGNGMGVRVYEVLAGGLAPVQFFDLSNLGSRPGFAMAVAYGTRMLYVLDEDAGIFVFAIDPHTGRLALASKEPVALGGFSGTMCMTSDERFLYATLPLSPKVPEVVVLAIGKDGIPEPIATEQSCPDVMSLRATSDNRFLYGASRAGDGICVWTILADGTLGTRSFVPDAEGEPAPQMLWLR